MKAPPAHVARAFGLQPAALVSLRGGQGTAWLGGDVVLKPLDITVEQLHWHHTTLAGLRPNGLRLAMPMRSLSGELVVDGWTAWPKLDGRHEERWSDILAAAEQFHHAVAALPRPAFLTNREDRWAHADRIAWEDDPAPPHVTDEVDWLLRARENVTAPDQLVHGDLSGNVLFADALPPAIIDLSLYWRPTGYASAIVVVDAIAWNHATVELLRPVLREPDGPQLLIRALLFRLLSDSDPAAGHYDKAIDRVRHYLNR